MEQGKFTLPRSTLFSLTFKLCQMLRTDPNYLSYTGGSVSTIIPSNTSISPHPGTVIHNL